MKHKKQGVTIFSNMRYNRKRLWERRKETLKKNLTILFVLFILAGIILLAGFVFPILIKAFLYEPYVKSIVLFVIFAIVVFRGRFTWNNYIMIPIAVVTIIGTFMDSAGNPFFNKPLEWLVSSVGQMQINTSVYNYAPGEYSITDQLRIIKSDGKIMELHTVFLLSLIHI